MAEFTIGPYTVHKNPTTRESWMFWVKMNGTKDSGKHLESERPDFITPYTSVGELEALLVKPVPSVVTL